MADKILNFESETKKMQQNIADIQNCNARIMRVAVLTNDYRKIKSLVIFACIALAFVAAAYVFGRAELAGFYILLTVAAGIAATVLIFKKQKYGKLCSVTIGAGTLCYLILQRIFMSVSIDSTVATVAFLLPIAMVLVNAGYIIFLYVRFKKAAEALIK